MITFSVPSTDAALFSLWMQVEGMRQERLCLMGWMKKESDAEGASL